MKRCPQCGTTYTDATLKFCLADGGLLEEVDVVSAPPTRREEGLQIDIPETPTAVSTRKQHTRGGLSAMAKLLIALGVFAVLGGLLVIVAAVAIYFVSEMRTTREPVSLSTPTPTAPSSTPAPSPEDVAEELSKRLEELAKKLEEQNRPGEVPKIPDLSDVLADGQVAHVNSPNDGFLALRSLPSADIGDRIDRIPHGRKVYVVSCNDQRETVAGRRGRWCLVEWESKVGWVFDAWLTYS